MVAIEVDGLTKSYGDVVAVDDLSVAVEDGEIFGLLGPNGAGKSTLINVLCTLLPPTAGTARVAGHDVQTAGDDVRSSIGVVFQEPALDEELTGEENLTFHGRLYGMGGSTLHDRIDEVLDLVDLADRRDERVGGYSGGMARRLELARGLLHRPEVLFLDEPTVGLDARTRRDTREYVRRLNEETGTTVVLTTHYMDEADALCDRVAIVDEGEIVALDAPEALKSSLGGDVVSLAVEGSAAPLRARLDAAPWASEYTTTDSGLRVTIERGDAHVADLVRLADDEGVSISGIDVRKPNLETVFLSLTGATLAEREADAPTDADVGTGSSPQTDAAGAPAEAGTSGGER
ncbi:ABC-2 type transport system ATP-binding protein [Natronoarchaeum philippinense]|uniref:ABC-2 type transport system ATP-binding protein n=1 Tax=Natronoarchaeum philippinense TaxID=558529 RepID=A0A285NYD5_NATPI|nr:ABC transporter ATP-binding protein [Natronoarchaeum philippinense]SNZ12651.1 ABC-2 type transport system ATP-binding protein [Natronoarchaeum philippinense]